MKIMNCDLCIQSASLEEIKLLNKVYEEACVYFSFDKKQEITKPLDCLTKGDLPPNGKKKQFQCFSVYQEHTLIGFVSIYEGYPNGETMYLSFIYITNANRGKGYGKKIVEMLEQYSKQRGFTRMRVAVSLKNWNGLKFWHLCGFSHVTQVCIDGPHTEENYGCIELERAI